MYIRLDSKTEISVLISRLSPSFGTRALLYWKCLTGNCRLLTRIWRICYADVLLRDNRRVGTLSTSDDSNSGYVYIGKHFLVTWFRRFHQFLNFPTCSLLFQKRRKVEYRDCLFRLLPNLITNHRRAVFLYIYIYTSTISWLLLQPCFSGAHFKVYASKCTLDMCIFYTQKCIPRSIHFEMCLIKTRPYIFLSKAQYLEN